MADKKLFELNENTTPADSKRLAIGDSSSGAENITLANFYTRLMSKLGFLKVANYLNEYQGWPSAQASVHNSINVYSKTQVDDKDALKANKSNVIEKDSTTQFVPTLATHPVNLKVIQDKIVVGLDFHFGDIATSTTKTVQIGKTVSSTNYIVLITQKSNNEFWVGAPIITRKTTTEFDINFFEDGGRGQDIYLDWCLIMQ